ncbi:MAG: hypothetical protein WD063_08495 [Pirellulales bacterium]
MSNVPDEVTQIIARAVSPKGALRFGGSYSTWHELGQAAPAVAGLYLIGFKVGVQYAQAASRILYVGSTVNLRTRLKAYSDYSHNAEINLLNQRYPGGLLATWIALPGMPVKWLRAIEDATLQAAFLQFGNYPACNRGRIDSPHVDSFANLIQISPCDGLLCPYSLAQLGKQVGSKTLGQLAKPKPPEHWKDANRNGPVKLTFTSTPQPAEPQPERFEREPSPLVLLENVATWDVDKMRRIVEICSRLTPVPKRDKTKATVLTFAAPNRQPPSPHTWGEVAALRGRRSIGSWNSNDRVWIKIVFEKLLLGQAIFENGGFIAEDKSDLPQCTARPSIWEDATWCDTANAMQGELSADFVAPADEVDSILNATTTDSAQLDQLRLLAAARESDIAWEKEKAIDRDKYRQIERLLCAQIDATMAEAADGP